MSKIQDVMTRAAVVAALAGAATGADAQTAKGGNSEGARKTVSVNSNKMNAQELFGALDAFMSNCEYVDTYAGPYRAEVKAANGDTLSIGQYKGSSEWAPGQEDYTVIHPKGEIDFSVKGTEYHLTPDGLVKNYRLQEDTQGNVVEDKNGRTVYAFDVVSDKEYKEVIAPAVAGIMREHNPKADKVVSGFCKKHSTLHAQNLFMAQASKMARK